MEPPKLLYAAVMVLIVAAVVIGLMYFFMPDVRSAISQFQEALRIG